MLVLALDTSATVAVALHDGDHVLARRVEDDPRRHAELLAPAVAAGLADAGRARREVTHVVAGPGPAPFTGLRVGVVTALVLAEALDVPVQGVCSLDALVATALDAARSSGGGPLAGELVAVTDAKRREVHWARYRVHDGADPLTGWARVDGPRVGPPAEVPALPAVGSGAALHPQLLRHRSDPPGAPDPGWLAALGADRITRGAPLEAASPRYLRRPDAAVPGAPEPVS